MRKGELYWTGGKKGDSCSLSFQLRAKLQEKEEKITDLECSYAKVQKELAMLRENLASKEQELQSLQTNRDARYVEQGNRGGVREEGVAEALGNSEIVESTQENQPSEDNAHPSTIEECSRAVEDKSESGDQQNELLKPQGDCLRSDETVETVRVIALEPAKQGGLEGEVKDMTEGEMEEKACVSSIEEEWVFVDGKKVLDSYVRELSTAVAEKDSKLAVVLAQVRQLEEQLNGEREEKLCKIQQLEEELKRVKELNALKVDAAQSGVIVVEGAVKGEGEVASEAEAGMQVPLQTKVQGPLIAEVQESPQSEVQGTTSQPEVQESPQSEVQESPQSEVQESPQSEVQESPQSEVQGTSQPEVQESPQSEVQGASQPEVQKSKEGREASIGIEVQMAAMSVGAYSIVVQEPSQTEVRGATVKSSAAEQVAAVCGVPQHEEACGERHEGDRKMSGTLDVSGNENAAEKISKLEELVKSLQEQLVEKNRELESKTGYLGIYCILQCGIRQQRRCVIQERICV